ncbi:cytochrome P450 [Cryptosporangium sp. NPDC051539]|uniref:cytochrome P450 n=1 Tax=Cryptosporangium sp. NPDC051539 TaxID=3363962 RepID=UPI003788E240
MTQEAAPRHSADEPAALVNDLLIGGVQDPYPLYAQLREIGDGVHWSDVLQGHLVTRYDQVRKIASDHETFSSDVFWGMAASAHKPEDTEHLRFIDIASRLFMFADPPTHTRIRSTFRHAFTPGAVARWEVLVAQVTRELLDRYPRGEELDIMPGFAADVPVAVIAEILGVPAEMRPKFREWSYAYASTFDPIVQGERRDAAIVTSLELFDYLAGLVRERKAAPREDLVSELVRTETIDGDLLGDVEMLAQVALLLVAGNETTTTLIGAGLTLLFDNPEALEEIRADRSLLPRAIEEMLRIDPPLHFVVRLTTKDVVVGEHELPAGSVVWACVPAANRDPRRFADPERFDIHRDDNKHLSFMHGIHFCVGAPLGRLEGRVVFDHILDAYPDIRAGQAPALRRVTNIVARGFDTRPVVL